MLGAMPPDLRASGSGGFAPKATPPLQISSYAPGSSRHCWMLNIVLEGLLVHPKITVPLKKKQKKNCK